MGLTITPEIARYYNLPTDHGILVTRVAMGSPAEAADMTDGDIILQIDETAVHRIEDLMSQIHKRKIIDKVRVYSLRAGRKVLFEVKLRKTA